MVEEKINITNVKTLKFESLEQYITENRILLGTGVFGRCRLEPGF